MAALPAWLQAMACEWQLRAIAPAGTGPLGHHWLGFADLHADLHRLRQGQTEQLREQLTHRVFGSTTAHLLRPDLVLKSGECSTGWNMLCFLWVFD